MKKSFVSILVVIFMLLVVFGVLPWITYLSFYELTHSQSFDFAAWLAALWFVVLFGSASASK